MQYRIDKKTGAKLSVLGFGCMRFPRSVEKTGELVLRAVEGGVNYFDTAYMYPGNEEALGLALEKHGLRSKVHIATKLPLVVLKGPEDFNKYLDKSLERLKTSWIDYFLLHMLSDTVAWERLKTWGIEKWIGEMKAAGNIRQLGFSFHGSRGEFLNLLDVYDWDFCQIQYNYSDENFQAGKTGLKKAAERMPVMVMEPLLGGKLADLPKKGLEIFKKADPHKSAAAWGLTWVWDHEEVTLLLSGMNEMSQLEENLRLADACRPAMLGDAERELYRRVIGALSSVMRIPCTGCNYCMPCPRHVNIPGCFSSYNLSYSMNWYFGVRNYITSVTPLSDKPGSPRLCIACGRCESHCPQHLPIRENLKKVRRRLEPFWVTWILQLARRLLRKGKKQRDS